MEVFQPVKVLPSKMVVKPSSVSAAGDRLTAPTRRIATRERTDFIILSLGDGASGNDEEIFAGRFWNRAAGVVIYDSRFTNRLGRLATIVFCEEIALRSSFYAAF